MRLITYSGPRGPPPSIIFHKKMIEGENPMSKFKLCFIFDESGDYKPVPYSKLMINGERRDEFKDKYFLPLNGYLLEVSREDYLDHYKNVNRHPACLRQYSRHPFATYTHLPCGVAGSYFGGRL